MEIPNKIPKKNMMIISFDQWRGDWGDPWGTGFGLVNLERIANEGWVGRRCYTSSPQCVPARLSWITGKYPSEIGVTKNMDVNIKKNSPSVIRLFEEAGWYTSIIGKTHWTSHRHPTHLNKTKEIIESLGFKKVEEIAGPRALRIVNCAITEDWEKEGWLTAQRDDLDARYRDVERKSAWKVKESVLPEHLYPDRWITEKSLREISKMNNENPWVIWVSYVGPHEPFDTPRKWKQMIRKYKVPKAYEMKNQIERVDIRSNLAKQERLWRGMVGEDEINELRKDYAAHLKMLDTQVKELMDCIKNKGMENNTDIIIMADHGEMLGDMGMLYKSSFLEGSIRVPFVYRPAGGMHIQRKFGQAVELTKVFAEIVRNSAKQVEAERIIEKICSMGDTAIIEYENETAAIRGKRKLVVNEDNEIMWRSIIKKSGEEEIIRKMNKKGEISHKWEDLLLYIIEHKNRVHMNEWAESSLVN